MLLAVETALEALSIALLDGDRIVAEHHAIVGRGHAETLMPAIAAVVGDRGSVVTAIVVDTGPGSFTGLRVGIAAARALGLAWGVPVTGVSSLALIAAADRAQGAVTVAVDAGRGQLYVQRFEADGTPLDTAPMAVAADGFVVAPGTVVVGGPPRAADARHLAAMHRSLPPVPLYLRAPDAVAA